MRTTTAPRTAAATATRTAPARRAPARDTITTRPAPRPVVVSIDGGPFVAVPFAMSDFATASDFALSVVAGLAFATTGLVATGLREVGSLITGGYAGTLNAGRARIAFAFRLADAPAPAPVKPAPAPAPVKPAARKPVTPQVDALPGMSPLGLTPAPAAPAPAAPAPAAKALPAPAVAAALKSAAATAHAAAAPVTVRVTIAGHGSVDVQTPAAEMADVVAFTRNHVAPRVAQYLGWPRAAIDYANRVSPLAAMCAVSHGATRQLASFAVIAPGTLNAAPLPARPGMGGAARPAPAVPATRADALGARMGLAPAGAALALAEARARTAGVRLSKVDRDAAIAVDAAARVSAAGRAPVSAAPRMSGATAAIFDAASRGIVPAAPDFTAETHSRYRPRLAALVALVGARDVAGLKAFQINPISTSPKALDRYRNAAVIALTAQSARKA